MKAVHFGAGNIGRGFVGLLLHEGGYEVVFSDVVAPLVAALDAAESYTVHEVGDGGTDRVVEGFRAISSAESPEAVAEEVATAQVVTTAVGPTVLKFIAPHVLAGLRRRDPAAAPLQVMACENAIGATDTLAGHMREHAGADWEQLSARAVFANTAVDRIVPGQPAGAGIDVTVEPFYEWAIERGPFGESLPQIPGAHFVDDLGPYIERKLFTVNTGHAAAAYLGARAGKDRIAEALAEDSVAAGVAAALEETSALLVAKHGFTPEDMTEYRRTILGRFRNPALPDTVQRVGRQPLRKLSRHERLIGPAAQAVERGLSADGLLAVVDAALDFRDPEDEQARQLEGLLADLPPRKFVEQVTGLEAEHALAGPVEQLVARRRG
ncbi:mannitol-1-phosphate 5-dehydrogenase [Nesterenkonia xinjiangensis]|uniref:Mannitol-1-phosphate 5-dehydrogenase n=1 Tax=Nesterenkonia xinjiangensis TaxID=225327 RepID=A0A7Z0GJY0_9MICC|nr:mannitol-1-phosphate 5-dehydrogenase [Nesterenkonia xinjiangensis]NYJ77369.1 mannitol-1-phosphate 5-dehydrogenase [Nesterenkonia xinjiangensis]